MKRDCNTCVYKEGSCYPSTMIFDKDKTCKSYVPDYEDYIAELEKENAELKVEVGISYEVYNDNLDYSYHIEEQLTEAKKIIGEFVEWANWQGSKCPSFKSIQNKAEQFLKTEALAVRSPKRTQNDPDKLTDDVMNGWKEMED